jgi:hypothetical protein
MPKQKSVYSWDLQRRSTSNRRGQKGSAMKRTTTREMNDEKPTHSEKLRNFGNLSLNTD